MNIIQQWDELELDPPRYSFIIQADPDDFFEEIKIMDEWLKVNIMNRYRRSPRQMAGRFVVDIFEANDAMIFKMVWK